MLYTVIHEHLEKFLREAADRGDGTGLPSFVEREFREFPTCGVVEHGFARVRCDGCAFERLVPLSCKGRGFCPSCGGQRMTERAAHLVDGETRGDYTSTRDQLGALSRRLGPAVRGDAGTR